MQGKSGLNYTRQRPLSRVSKASGSFGGVRVVGLVSLLAVGVGRAYFLQWFFSSYLSLEIHNVADLQCLIPIFQMSLESS